MHQTQSGDELPSVDVHLLVQEDKVHLEEDEDQLKTDSQEPELILIPEIVFWLEAEWFPPGHSCCISSAIFQYFSQLHPSIDETANAKDWKETVDARFVIDKEEIPTVPSLR